MTTSEKRANRYWGSAPLPTSKAEFFDAVTTPAPSGDGSVATIRIYGPIDSWGGYWGVSAKDVGQVLDGLSESVNQIVLRINSPGGHVFEGVSILNMLRAHKATVTAVVDGLAASAASVILAGCDEAVASPGTQLMIHSPSTIAWGNATHLRKQAEVLDKIEASIVDIYEAKAGEKDWPALLADETWLTPAEALEMGLVDRVGIVPDAGAASTVGSDDEPDEGDDDFEDRVHARVLFAAQALPPQSKLPDSVEPGDPNQKEKLSMSDTIKAGLRERLGVTDAEATDETLLAALDQALEEQADPATPVATVPEGAVVVDAAAFKDLQASAALGAQARAEQISARRDAVITSALAEGRITSASRDMWRAQLDKDEEGMTALISNMEKNKAVAVAEIGHGDTVLNADESLYGAIYSKKEA